MPSQGRGQYVWGTAGLVWMWEEKGQKGGHEVGEMGSQMQSFVAQGNFFGYSGRTHHRDLSRGLRDLNPTLKDLPSQLCRKQR